MKLTLQIDDGLLKRIMKATGAINKSQAIDLALQQIGQRALLAKMKRAAQPAAGQSKISKSPGLRPSPRKASVRSRGT